jgi:hypothetical protein
MKYTSRITQMTVLAVGESLFSERATVISIEDEAAGEYIKITQQMDATFESNQTVSFDAEEWEEVTDVVNQMFGEIRRYEEETRTDVQQS